MNSKMLLDALGDISDEYVMGAQKYLTNDVLKITNSKAHQRTVPQKLLIHMQYLIMYAQVPLLIFPFCYQQ